MIINPDFLREPNAQQPTLPAIIPNIASSDIIEVEAVEMPNNFNLIDSPFGWDIAQEFIYDRSGLLLPDYKLIRRNDTGAVLNVCRSSYTPTPNYLFAMAVNEMSTATGFDILKWGEVQGGNKVFAYLRNPENFKIGDYKYEDYIIIGNSHDGSSAFFVGSSNMMVRCSNQFTQTHQNLKAYHKSNNAVQVFEIAKFFSHYQQLRLQQSANYNKMLQQSVTTNDRERLVREVLAIPADLHFSELSTRKQNTLEALNVNIDREMFDIGKNALGLFNGVTRWTTHDRDSKQRVFGNFYGSQNEINQKAYNFCTNL